MMVEVFENCTHGTTYRPGVFAMVGSTCRVVCPSLLETTGTSCLCVLLLLLLLLLDDSI